MNTEKYMKYIKQFFIIIGISFIGELLNTYIPLPIPASIYGIVILFLSLCFHIIKLEDVEETGMFLTSIMGVMFIPAAVGISESWNMISQSLFKYALLIFLTTVIVMGVTGVITELLLKKEGEQ